jgi:putative ABC transport system permease protein
MGDLLRDINYGTRSLLKDRSFTITALVTLAVCIAVNTATFAIVNSVLLRPLPVPHADSILLMSNQYSKAGVGISHNSASGDYYDRLQEVTAFQEQALFRFQNETIMIGEASQQVRGMLVTPSLFPLLRAHPLMGRTFSNDEGEVGGEQKVILSYGLWQQLYAGSKSALGQQMKVNSRPYTIVGVMPRDFNFVNPEIRLWLPIAFTPKEKTVHHSNNYYNIGLLKPGATVEQVQAQVNALNAENLERFASLKQLLINAGFYTKVEPLQEMLVHDIKGILYLLWGGAIFVLLIGGLNITNLALARLGLRRKELATRLALGARRSHLVRQIMVENLLLALAGGVAGIGVGAGLLRALSAMNLNRFPRANEVSMHVDVVIAALAMATLVGVLIGMAPIAAILNYGMNNVLREEGRTGTGAKSSRRVRQGLVIAQIGFAFSLLMGAGLLLASFRQLLKVDPGYLMDGIATASTMAPKSRYASDDQLRTLLNRSLDAVRQIPGVISAGATTMIPLGDNHSDSIILAEGYQMKPSESVISPIYVSATPGYFETMRIALVRGRYFQDSDISTSQPVIIVDEELAQRFWPNQDPIGHRMYQPSDSSNLLKTDEHTRWLYVVGVVRSVRIEDLSTSPPVGVYYFPYSQSPERYFTLTARTAGSPESIMQPIRSKMAAIDPELAIFDVHTMSERGELSLASRRTSMTLALGFGALALFLAAIGIYAVLAFVVAQRRREIGIRVALGSTPGRIVRLVLHEGLVLVGLGLVVGIAGSFLLRSAVASQIYRVSPFDPLVLLSVIAVLGVIALAACLVPARRAVQVDPMIVLNEQ